MKYCFHFFFLTVNLSQKLIKRHVNMKEMYFFFYFCRDVCANVHSYFEIKPLKYISCKPNWKSELIISCFQFFQRLCYVLYLYYDGVTYKPYWTYSLQVEWVFKAIFCRVIFRSRLFNQFMHSVLWACFKTLTSLWLFLLSDPEFKIQ